MDTILTILVFPSKFFLRYDLNETFPGKTAYMVSSLPFLVPDPATNLDPLCLTIMLPAAAVDPADNFTPSLLDIESRPKWVVPPALVCAIV